MSIEAKHFSKCPEEEIKGIVDGIRKDFQGISHDSPHAEALIHAVIFVKTCAEDDGDGLASVLLNKVAIKREESGEYWDTFKKLTGLVADVCPVEGDGFFKTMRMFGGELDKLATELFPQHSDASLSASYIAKKQQV